MAAELIVEKTNDTNQKPSLMKLLAAPLLFALGLCLMVVCCYDKGSDAAQDVTVTGTEHRYANAKSAMQHLRNDARSSGRRDKWERLVGEFTDIYKNDSQWPNRPAALFRAAECMEELADRTCAATDAQQAAGMYEQVAKAHPKSKLADDALYRAAHIHAARLGDDGTALKLVERLKKQYAKGDMYPLAQTLEKAIRASRQGRTAPEARQVSRLVRSEVREESVAESEGRAPAQEKTQDAPGVAVASLDASVPASTGKGPVIGEENGTAQPSRPQAKAQLETSVRPELHVVSWDSPNKNSVEIVLEMSAPAQFGARLVREGKSDKKGSVVLELENVRILEELRHGARIKGSLLTAIRVEQNKADRTRLCFDFRDVRHFETRRENNPCRIILSVAGGPVPRPEKSGATGGFAENAKPAGQAHGTPAAVASADAPDPASVLPREVPAKDGTPVRSQTPMHADIHKASVTSNMASQLGLSVQRVFIDAGHGGRDPGTAHNNVLEHVVTHDVAQTLGRLLEANGFEVVFSRDRNAFVPLGERTNLANAARADLFVSIHVNANDDKRVQGLETYFLDIARNSHAARVAALENAGSDRRLGDMQDMLADVMLNARVGESRNLAHDVQRSTLYRLKKRDYTVRNSGVKSAPFHVLIGAQMPAVLVELGYCSNREEAARLQDADYRKALAEGLAEGIMAYQKRLQTLQTASR